MFKKYSIIFSFLFLFFFSALHAQAFSFSTFFGNLFHKAPAPAVEPASVTPLGANVYDATVQNQPEVMVNPTITKPTTSSTTTTKPVATDTTPTTSVCVVTSFIASPSQIKIGTVTKISWVTSGCTSVTINDKNYPANSSLTTEPLTATKKFTLFASNSTEKKLVTKTLSVVVSGQENNFVMGGTDCAITSFSASPASIASGGYSTLSWSTTSCTSVKIGDVGGYPVSGTLKVGPLTATKTYTMTAYGEAGNVTKTTTVTVTNTQTSCLIKSFTALPMSIASGASSTLSWSTTGCTGITLSLDVSNDYPATGSASTGPLTATKTYTLSGTGSNGVQSKTVTVVVTGTTTGAEKILFMEGMYVTNDKTVTLNDIYSSGDMLNWQSISPNNSTTTTKWSPRSLSEVVYFNNKYWVISNHDTLWGGNVAAADAWSSADGINWTLVNSNLPFRDSIYSTGPAYKIVVLGPKMYAIQSLPDAKVWSSSDGVTWNLINTTAAFGPLNYPNVASFNGKIYVMGGNPVSGGNTLTNVWSSPDGIVWSKISSNGPQSYLGTSIVYNNKLYVLGGERFIGNSGGGTTDTWSSSDGITWTLYPNSLPPTSSPVDAVVANGKMWIIGESSADYSPTKNKIWSSCDSSSWTESSMTLSWQARLFHRMVSNNGTPLGGTSCQTQTPTITVTSPNGGETYTAGQQITVTWKTTNIPTTDVLVLDTLYDGVPFDGGLTHPFVNNTGSFTYTLPSSEILTKYGRSTGKHFQIQLQLVDTVTGIIKAIDSSDATFTINPATTGCVVNSFTAKLPAGYTMYSNYHDLTWTTTGCTSVSINGVTEPVNGSITTPAGSIPPVYPVDGPFGTMTYTLVANNTVEKKAVMYYPFLSFSPSSTTPPNQTFAAGSVNVKLADFDMRLSTNVTPQTVDKLYLQGSCLPKNSVNPLKNMRFMIGTTQIGILPTSQSCNSDGRWYDTIDVASQNVVLNANETKKISILVDIDKTATTGAQFTPFLSGGLQIAYSAGSGANANTTTISTGTASCSINSFTANPTSVNSGGSSILSWSTTGCAIAGLGGSMVVTNGTSNTGALTQTTTYTLYAGTLLPVGCPSFIGYSSTTGLACSTGAQSKTVTVTVVPIVVTKSCSIDSFTLPTTMSASASSIAMTGLSTSNCTKVWAEINSGYSTRRYTELPNNGSYTFANSPATGTSDTSIDVTLFASNGTSIISQTKSIAVSPVTHTATNQCQFINVSATPNPSTSGQNVTLSWVAPTGCIVYLEKVTPDGSFKSLFKTGTYYYNPTDSAVDIASGPATYYLTAQAGYYSGTDNTSVLGAKTIDVNSK